ncbi:MAG: C45 family peptidase [Thermoplasmata archaeon]|nr:C45 family peptidase [Thermoplasmata archaeon]
MAVCVAIALSLTVFVPAGTEGDDALPTVAGMPVVVLSGTHEERGTAYGEAVGPMIRDNLGMFWDEARAKGMDRGAMAARALDLSPSMPEHMVTEIRTMAEAAGVDFGELMAMNMFGSSVRSHDGCTIVVAVGTGSESGNTLASKTRDANAPNVLLIVEPIDDLHGFMAVAGAGDWGISFGINDQGLADGNNWVPVPEYFEGGWDENPLNRHVLEMCADVDESIELVSTVEKYGGTSVMVADKDSAAFIEAVSSCYSFGDGEDTTWVRITDGVAVHTNHYILDPFFDWVVNDEFGYFWVPSVSRMDRAYELLHGSGDVVTAQELTTFTRDVDDWGCSQPQEIIDAHPEMPWGTWGFGWPGFSICNIRTVAAGVFEIDPVHPETMSVMWTSVNCPGYTPYFPLHNGLMQRPAELAEALSVYVDGTVWKAASLLREGTFAAWIELAPVLGEWEAGAFEANAEAEDSAEEALASGDIDGAVSALSDSDTALGLEAYGFILELSS